MTEIIIFNYLVWHFLDFPKEIFKAWKNYLVFNLNYFSVPILLKTYFSHWHKYKMSYGKGIDPWRWFEAFVFNVLMSRFLGAILRTFFIVIGVVSELIIFLIGLIIFLAWFCLPFFLLLGFIYGVKLIF